MMQPSSRADAQHRNRAGTIATAFGLILSACGGQIVSETLSNVGTGLPEPTAASPGAAIPAPLSYGQEGESGRYELLVMAADGSATRTIPGVVPISPVAWSPDGTRAAFVDQAGLHVMNADGSDREPIAGGDEHSDVAWAPDGTRLAFSRSVGDGADIFVSNPDGSDVRQLTHGPGISLAPDWSPDSTQLVFAREIALGGGDGNPEHERGFRFQTSLHLINADGSNIRTLLLVDAIVGYPAWSPDGSWIAFNRRPLPASGLPSSHNPPWDIWLMAADGSQPRPLTSSPALSEVRPAWSPDGELIAFAARQRSGLMGIYVIGADGTQSRLVAGPAPIMGDPSWMSAVEPPSPSASETGE